MNFDTILYVMLGIAAFIFLFLLIVPASYGRFYSKKWGPQISAFSAWWVMEIPTILVFIYFFIVNPNATHLVPILMSCLWLGHYVHRTIIFPFKISKKKEFSLIIALSGFFFQVTNTSIQAIAVFDTGYTASWLSSPQFLIGVCVFFVGQYINKTSDAILQSLKRADGKYSIPQGWLFRYISCPNYLGEIIIWSGWAILLWNLAGLVFFFWVLANLTPRALSYHKWYKENFDYPKDRKALIPFIL